MYLHQPIDRDFQGKLGRSSAYKPPGRSSAYKLYLICIFASSYIQKGKIGISPLSPKCALKSKNPFHDAQRWHMGNLWATVRANRAHGLGRVGPPNSPHLHICILVYRYFLNGCPLNVGKSTPHCDLQISLGKTRSVSTNLFMLRELLSDKSKLHPSKHVD